MYSFKYDLSILNVVNKKLILESSVKKYSNSTVKIALSP